MQTLVTGCAGFIGSQLSETLLDAGHAVRGVDAFTNYYDPARKRANVSRALDAPGFDLVEADLTSTNIESLLDGVDVVFHLAGQPGVRVSWSDGFPVYVAQNILATQRLLEAAKSHPVSRLVYASSSSVYGNADRYPVRETDLPKPHSPYGVTKLAAEHLCSLYAENWQLPTVSLRYFSVYGPRQRPDMGFTKFFGAALAGTPLPIYGTGKQIRDFTYVGDVVAATVAAGTADVAPGTVCNVAGGSAVTVEELFPIISELVGHEVPIEHLPAQPGDVFQTGGSSDKARELLRWEPKVSIHDGLAAQYEWISTAAPINGS